MVHQHKNVFISLKGREIGFGGRIRSNILPHFAEEIAATSSTDNKACNLPGTPRCTFLISFSKDRKLVASSHVNHSINISRLSTGEHIQTLTGHPRSPWCVTFHPSSNEILASGCLGGEVRVWDLQGSSELWQSDNQMIASLSFHPRDQVLAIATNDQILLWDWRQPVPFASVSISSPLEKVRLVRFSPLGHNLLTGIANAPVDEEEPEYENLDVQHEAYQSSARLTRRGVPEHLNPYSRPSRLDSSLPGHYPTGLSTMHNSAAAYRQTRRPLSPDQSESLEDAREYAAAVTLTALGLRRVNPASNLPQDFSYTGWRRGNHRSSSQPSGPQDRRVGRYSEVGSSTDPQTDHGRSGDGISNRTGTASAGSALESSNETGYTDNTGSGVDWVGMGSTTDRHSSNDPVDTPISAASGYVNMDVTNGDEIREARTSVPVPQAGSSGSRFEGPPQVGRSQQLPLNSDAQNLASSKTNQEGSEDGSKPLDLAAGLKCSPGSSTSSQYLDPCSSTAGSNDCQSPEAKRLRPDFTSEVCSPRMTESDSTSSNNGLPSSSWDRTEIRHTAQQRLSFSDAEVSSAIQEIGTRIPSGSTSVLEANSSTSVISGGLRPQSSDQEAAGWPSAGATSLTAGLSASQGLVGSESEAQMQPALPLQSLSRPQAAVMRRDVVRLPEQPRAFTAHLGTIPHTPPPDSTSGSSSHENTVQRRGRGDSPSTNESDRSANASPNHHLRSASPSASTFHSISSSAEIVSSPPTGSLPRNGPGSSPSSGMGVPSPPPSDSNAAPLQPPQLVSGTGLHWGMRALRFGADGGGLENGEPTSAGGVPNLNNPLDLSIARPGNSNETEAADSSSSLHQPETNSIPQSCQNRTTNEDGATGTLPSPPHLPPQSDSSRGASLPSADYLPCNLDANNSSRLDSESETPLPQGIDLTVPSAIQGTRPDGRPTAPDLANVDQSRSSRYQAPDSASHQLAGGSAMPAPALDSVSSLPSSCALLASEAASRYRRYNLWRSPGLHRQRGATAPSQSADPDDAESGVENSSDELRASSTYGARRVAPLHTRRHLHVALLNQPSRQLTDMERMDMAARVQRRLLRQSRQGPLRAQLGRLSGQFSGHHHHPRTSIFDETYQPPPPVIHATINRAIARRGETAVANNIGNTTYRLQWWDFSEFELPDISDGDHNVIVPHCKLHNDASCDVSQDGRYLAAFVPSPLGFPDDGVLAIYSLMPHNFGDVLYTKSFGPNAITVSISPLGGFVVVGLASRKLHLHMGAKQLIGMIYKLHKEGAAEDSLLHVCDVDHACTEVERRHHVSVNTIKWIPQPGGGLVYGTNRGDLRICSPSNFTAPDDVSTSQNYQPDYSSLDDLPRHDLVHRRRSYNYMYQEFGLRNLGLHQPSSSSAGANSAPERRARGTQTPQRELLSTATQTDDISQ